MEEAVNFSVRDEDGDELRVRFLGGRIMVSVGGEFGILWPTPAQARQIATALLRLAAEVDGEDWRVVPAEPTDEMRRIGRDIGNLRHHLNAFHDDAGDPDAELLDGASRAIYRAMLSKAPAPEGDGA